MWNTLPSKHWLSMQLTSKSDQLTLISCNDFQQKIASESVMKVYTSLAQRRSNFLEQLLAQVVTTVKLILKISF